MRCVSPLSAFRRSEGGKLGFVPRVGRADVPITIPCGQCVECRLERSRQWAVRIMHEASMHESNCFVTLTYSPEALLRKRDIEFKFPGSLDYRDFQLFMKRMRFKVGKVRFFMCGEYGEKEFRPHFHACLFGIRFSDRYPWRMSPAGHQLYRSDMLESFWDFGAAEIGELSFESAAYVARYCMKKVTGDPSEAHYAKLDLATGEVYDCVPEFARMSLKPGIGFNWFEKFHSDVFPHDMVVVNGVKCKPPRYYDLQLERVAPLTVGILKEARAVKARLSQAENTPARLAARAEVTSAGLSYKKRNL